MFSGLVMLLGLTGFSRGSEPRMGRFIGFECWWGCVGPQADGPQADGPQAVGPQGAGPQEEGPQGAGPQGEGPQGEGPQGLTCAGGAQQPCFGDKS